MTRGTVLLDAYSMRAGFTQLARVGPPPPKRFRGAYWPFYAFRSTSSFGEF
jgi:hypothetical protein